MAVEVGFMVPYGAISATTLTNVCVLCYLLIYLWFLAVEFRRYIGVWLIQHGTTLLFLDTRSLSWGFLLGFWCCLTFKNWSHGLLSCQQWCSEDGENSQTFESWIPRWKVQGQETIRDKLFLKAAQARSYPTLLGHGVHDRGHLQGWQDEEIKNMLENNFSGAELCCGRSSHSDKMTQAPARSCRFAPPWLELCSIGFGPRGIRTEAGPDHFFVS